MLPIVYQDRELVCIHKPPGLLVHRTNLDRHETRFAVQLLRDQIGQRVYPVHRLDKGTSGLLLFALSPEVAKRLTGEFAEGRVDKRYLAVVRGHPEESGTIDHPLARTADDYVDTSAEGDAAKPAVTLYRRLATCELPIAVDRYPSSRYALLELNPLTGRRHQIRRHLKHISHPVIGDATYGKGRHNRMFQERLDCHRLLLACAAMTFTHPVSGQPLALNGPLADDFAILMKRLDWFEALPPQWRPEA
ncbi:MAG TPA: pseudouridine synthase [Rhodocyclaceae bacterium]